MSSATRKHQALAVLATAFAAALGMLAVLVGTAQPTRADDEEAELIAFASNRSTGPGVHNTEGDFEIFVMNADGTNPVQLTTNAVKEDHVAWSPDGTKIAFTRGEFRVAKRDIWVMNADGTGETQLTTFASTVSIRPTWSPDGTKIAFVSGRDFPFDNDIWVMDADGSDQRSVTNDDSTEDGFGGLDWSPDGKRTAFDSFPVDAACGFAVHTMGVKGNDVRTLTDESLEAYGPAWSPSGDQLAFSDHACSDESDLFVMQANGESVTQLLETPENETGAKWSPDGGRIAFERFELNGTGVEPGTGDIYVIGKDGEGLTNLTKSPGNSPGADDQSPDWRPEQDD